MKHAYWEVITDLMLLFLLENLKLHQALDDTYKVHMLLNAGASINVSNSDGKTPLHKGNKMNYLLIYL